MPELNSRQFFHGTTAKFEPGDVILPASEIGKRYHSPSVDADEPEGDVSRVFSAPDERDAWAFAQSAHRHSYWQNMSDDRGDEFGNPYEDRPYVYEVEPEGTTESRYQEGMLHTPSETLSDRARVVRRIDAPPPMTMFFDSRETGVATQPTLPGDDPNFAHGFMTNEEEDRQHVMSRIDFGMAGRSPERVRGSAMEAERSFRRRQDEAASAGRTHQPTMFNVDEFHDRGEHMQDTMYRSRW